MQQAAETYTLEQATLQLPEMREWVDNVLRRLHPLLPEGELTVLEIGSAQGRCLVALSELGHKAVGVEPHRPALAVAADLAVSQGLEIEMREGVAESIPYESGRFDLVLAFSVLEHVVDIDQTLTEIHRALKGGGVLWFNSASAMCPIQEEITHLPLFGWYPNPLKRRIMVWATDNRPAWVGYTRAPAMHWWTPWKARRLLGRAGFVDVQDRWELRRPEELTGRRAAVVRLLQRYPLLRIGGDILVPGCSYAAIKPPDDKTAQSRVASPS